MVRGAAPSLLSLDVSRPRGILIRSLSASHNRALSSSALSRRLTTARYPPPLSHGVSQPRVILLRSLSTSHNCALSSSALSRRLTTARYPLIRSLSASHNRLPPIPHPRRRYVPHGQWSEATRAKKAARNKTNDVVLENFDEHKPRPPEPGMRRRPREQMNPVYQASVRPPDVADTSPTRRQHVTDTCR